MITTEGEEWDPNTRRSGKNEVLYKDVNEQMMTKKNMGTVLVNDDDFIEDEAVSSPHVDRKSVVW